jgi:hypothetical protein
MLAEPLGDLLAEILSVAVELTDGLREPLMLSDAVGLGLRVQLIERVGEILLVLVGLRVTVGVAYGRVQPDFGSRLRSTQPLM